jgi:hypothetical protein
MYCVYRHVVISADFESPPTRQTDRKNFIDVHTGINMFTGFSSHLKQTNEGSFERKVNNNLILTWLKLKQQYKNC